MRPPPSRRQWLLIQTMETRRSRRERCVAPSWQRRSYRALEIRKGRLELIDCVERSQPDVTARLQRLQQGADPRLPELVCILGQLLNLLRLRNDLITIADEQLPLRLRALRCGGHLALNAEEGRLTLGHELVERGLLDEHAGTMRREERECDG